MITLQTTITCEVGCSRQQVCSIELQRLALASQQLILSLPPTQLPEGWTLQPDYRGGHRIACPDCSYDHGSEF